MIFKTVYGLVEKHLPTYIQRKVRMTRTMHQMHFIQIQTTNNYYTDSFFPLAVVQCNNLPSQAVLSYDLSLYRSTICCLNHTMPEILRKCFYQLLTFYFSLLTLFYCTKIILTFFYHSFSFSGARSCTKSSGGGVAGWISLIHISGLHWIMGKGQRSVGIK